MTTFVNSVDLSTTNGPRIGIVLFAARSDGTAGDVTVSALSSDANALRSAISARSVCTDCRTWISGGFARAESLLTASSRWGAATPLIVLLSDGETNGNLAYDSCASGAACALKTRTDALKASGITIFWVGWPAPIDLYTFNNVRADASVYSPNAIGTPAAIGSTRRPRCHAIAPMRRPSRVL